MARPRLRTGLGIGISLPLDFGIGLNLGIGLDRSSKYSSHHREKLFEKLSINLVGAASTTNQSRKNSTKTSIYEQFSRVISPGQPKPAQASPLSFGLDLGLSPGLGLS